MNVDQTIRLRRRLRRLLDLQADVSNEIQRVRVELSAASGSTARPKPPCGTDQGYQWHRYHEPENWPLPLIDPCGCRRAHTEKQRLREVARREQKRKKVA